MTTITKERAKQIFLGIGDAPTACEERELARIALASLEAEPVAWRYRTTDINGNPKPRWSFSEDASLRGLYQPLYTAQPAPVLEPAISDNSVHDLFLRAKSLMYQSGGSPIEHSLNPVDAWLFEAERSGLPVAPLYTAQPAPAVIDERALFDAWNNEDNLPIAGVGAKNAAWLAWQARSQLASLPSPAPVVPEKMIADPEADVIDPGFIAGWNACRAAMLNSPSASKGE
ncbi:hypothetical protein [Edwardsiella piscicida]|uniref:hypothetical protein n=1 Tax=Edwardsiella piscicida TaxID=1263550 RepID=UPI00370D94BB